MVSAKRADFQKIARECGISPILARIIRNRDVDGTLETRAFLEGSLEDIPSTDLLFGAGDAAMLLQQKIERGDRIRIIGDYDVDGICSSYIFWRAIKECGGNVDVRLPDRVVDGYGINARLVREALEEGVDTILTCDNGIAAVEPLALAKESGMTVIVTDHHEIPYEMVRKEKPDSGENEAIEVKKYVYPPADVGVNPKMRVLREDGTAVDAANGEDGGADEQFYYPFTEICGAEVAYKISLLLLEKMSPRTGRYDSVERELLAFCALATICDVMPLQKENRIIVREGLKVAGRTQNIGLMALLQVTGLWGSKITCYHAGFVIGPCLNATGRLDNAERALHLFMEQDQAQAMVMAQELKNLNDGRKSMTLQGVERAEQYIEEHDLLTRKVLLVPLEDCHESLAGIIAGRIKERYYRPTFVLTRTDHEVEGSVMYKGSGRSIEAYDMFEEMNKCKERFVKFGGHKMAAGLSLKEEDIVPLDREMNDNCTLCDEDLTETIHIDMELPPRFLDFQVTRQLQLLEPCGTGNVKPIFVTRGIRLTNARILGKNRNVVKFRARDDAGIWLELICFESEEIMREKIPSFEQLVNGNGNVTIDMVYYPEINEWNGRESMQYIIKDFRVKTENV